MSTANAKPSYNAGRRIRWLAAGVVAAVLAYSGGWFWIAGQIDETVAAYTEAGANGSASIACAGRDVRGYPFRLGVFCDRVAYSDPSSGLAVEAGAVRSAAQVYNPRRVLAEIDSPVVITETGSGETYQIDWERGRAHVVTAPTADQRLSFEAEGATFALNGSLPLARAAQLDVHMREREAALDVATRPRGVTLDSALVGGRDLPEFGVDLDLRLEDWRSDWASDQISGSGIVNRLSLLLTDDRGVIVEGPFNLSAEGLLSGEFDVRIVDVPGVVATFGAAFPEMAPQIAALGSVQPAEGEAEDELALRLTIRDGRVFAGFIPLGTLPPIPLSLL